MSRHRADPGRARRRGTVAWQRGSSAWRWSSPWSPHCPRSPWPGRCPGRCWSSSACVLAVVGWHRWSRTSATVTRWGARTRRKAGVASTFDIARVASGVAMRRAGTVRPSLAELSRWARWRLPAVEVAVQLCRVGLLRVWSRSRTCTSCSAARAPARPSGWPGGSSTPPAPSWSPRTRTDLYELTAPLRARRGPVYVFNAVGLAGLAVDDHVRPADRLRRPGDRDRAGHGHARRHHRARRAGRGTGSSGTPRPAASWPRCCTPPRSADRPMRDVLGVGGRPGRGRSARCRSLLRRAAEPAFEQDVDAVRRRPTTAPAPRSPRRSCPRSGWLDQPGRGGRRRARTRPGSTSPSCSRAGRRCSCSARRRPRPRRWCAR